jgi:hypothetical protein
MTKALRTTMYSPQLEPITIVMMEDQLKAGLTLADLHQPEPGVLLIFDEFETDGDVAAATMEAAARQAAQTEDESNLAIWYYWNAMQLTRLAPGGSLANPAPAPLSANMLISGMEQLRLHPAYQHQSVISISMDGDTVVMRSDGTVETMPPFTADDPWDR